MMVVVFGGTGQVGGALVDVLVKQGVGVRAVGRSADKAALLPAGAIGCVADLDRPESLAAALHGADAVFLMVPNGPAETHQGLTALSMIVEAAPAYIVYLSNDLSVSAPQVPHGGAKLGIEAAIRASGIRHTILRPTYFAQNDLLVRDALLAGVYPVPLGTLPVSRIDVRDVADAVAKALLEGAGEGQSIFLSSMDQPNGEETAGLWSAAFDAPIVFPNESPDDWANGVRWLLPAWLVFDLRLMYRHLQRAGRPVCERDLEAQATLLPHGPRSYRAFIDDCARDWRGAPGPAS